MALPAFDTYAYVKRLKQAGFNEEQAVAQSELQAQVLSALVTEKLATKADIARLENELKNESTRLENELKNELKNEITRVEHELKSEITRVEHETKQEFVKIMGKFSHLNWMISFLLTGVATLVFKSFLHG
jgi:predicted phage-related endonuclease